MLAQLSQTRRSAAQACSSTAFLHQLQVQSRPRCMLVSTATHQQPCRQGLVRACAAAQLSPCQHTTQPQQLSNSWCNTHKSAASSRGHQCVPGPSIPRGHGSSNRCWSSSAYNPNLQQHEQGQQSDEATAAQQQQPAVGQEGGASSGTTASRHMPHIMHMQPPPQPVRVPQLLAWLPPRLLLHLQSLAGFLHACWALLPEFVAPSIPEALRRLVLVLGASLVMIVVISTIDSGWLYLYLLNARGVPGAA